MQGKKQIIEIRQRYKEKEVGRLEDFSKTGDMRELRFLEAKERNWRNKPGDQEPNPGNPLGILVLNRRMAEADRESGRFERSVRCLGMSVESI